MGRRERPERGPTRGPAPRAVFALSGYKLGANSTKEGAPDRRPNLAPPPGQHDRLGALSVFIADGRQPSLAVS